MRRGPENVLLLALALWSLVPLAILLVGPGDFFNGSDGIQVDDQMQYLAFVRESGEHGLTSNLFDVVPDPHLFLHPMFALSGLLWKLGVSIQLSFLIWKPIVVLALFLGFAAYVRRLLGDNPAARLAALALALFYLAPATFLADWFDADAALRFGTFVVGFEPYAAGYTWGGFPGAISVAAMPCFLLAIERVLVPERRGDGRSARWYAGWAGVAGLLASWLHPWQGMTLLAIVGLLVVWDRFDRRYLKLALPVALTAAPLVYFFALSHTDSSWDFVSQPNDYPHVGLWLFLGFAPLLFALPGYLGHDLDLQERILRLWPVAALCVYFTLQQSWFYHAFTGLSLPLAVLAVQAWQRMRLPRAAAAVTILAVTVPGLAFAVSKLVDARGDHFYTSDEHRALDYLEQSSVAGAVLAPQKPLGLAVPAHTGRQTYVGNYYWTPGYDQRRDQAERLFSARMGRPEAADVVRRSRVRFLAADCDHPADLRPILGPRVARVRRFGCATVYELRQGALQAQSIPAS